MPVDALFEKLRLAERRLTAAEERVAFCRAAAAKASAVLGGECVSRSRDVTANENAVIRLMEAEQEYAEAEQQYRRGGLIACIATVQGMTLTYDPNHVLTD